MSSVQHFECLIHLNFKDKLESTLLGLRAVPPFFQEDQQVHCKWTTKPQIMVVSGTKGVCLVTCTSLHASDVISSLFRQRSTPLIYMSLQVVLSGHLQRGTSAPLTSTPTFRSPPPGTLH